MHKLSPCRDKPHRMEFKSPRLREQKPAHPEPQVFQRGQFTFNRRFLETKFSGFSA